MHDQKAWNVDSLVKLHPGQRSSFTIFLFLRLAFEGSESDSALHKIVLTLLGTCSLHTPFQRLLVSDKFEAEGSPFSTSSISLLYSNLTEYAPSGVCGQKI